MCYAIGSDQGYYPRRYKGLVPSRFNILMKRRAPYPDGQWLERRETVAKKSQEILSWEIFCWEILIRLVELYPQISYPLNASPRNFVRQERSSPGSMRIGRTFACQDPTPQTFVWVRSCAPNIRSYGAEELGELLFACEGAAGRTFAWAIGAARSAATNKKKKKKIFFPFYYIIIGGRKSSENLKILQKNFLKRG